MTAQKYQRIFAALDGRSGQFIVARRAVQVASRNRASLMFGHVVEAIPTEMNTVDFGELCDAFRDKVEADLGEILEQARADQNIPEVEVRVVAGSVNETLATRLIKPYEPDLIVCGERGLTNFQYAFMGSTSKYLIRTQDCDVLVVKEQ